MTSSNPDVRCRFGAHDTRPRGEACPSCKGSTIHGCESWAWALKDSQQAHQNTIDALARERAAHAATRAKLERLEQDAGAVLRWLNEASGCPCCDVRDGDHDPDMPCGKLWASPSMGGPRAALEAADDE